MKPWKKNTLSIVLGTTVALVCASLASAGTLSSVDVKGISTLENGRFNLGIYRDRALAFSKVARGSSASPEKTRVLLDLLATSRRSVLRQPISQTSLSESYFVSKFDRVEKLILDEEFAAAANAVDSDRTTIENLITAMDLLN